MWEIQRAKFVQCKYIYSVRESGKYVKIKTKKMILLMFTIIQDCIAAPSRSCNQPAPAHMVCGWPSPTLLTEHPLHSAVLHAPR